MGEHLQTSASLLGSMSIAKFTSIRTVIRITCEMNGKFTALTTVQESSGCNMAETYESLLYWYQVNSPGSMQTKPKPPQKKQHVTHHSSQNLLDPRNPRGQTCDIWTVEGCHDTMEATTMSVSCAEPILFVWLWYLVGKASKSIGLIIIIVIVPTD